jgi:hypothetical protein
MTKKPHSADYFGDTRDFWWNHDFLKLMSARWNLADVRRALDVERQELRVTFAPVCLLVSGRKKVPTSPPLPTPASVPPAAAAPVAPPPSAPDR